MWSSGWLIAAYLCGSGWLIAAYLCGGVFVIFLVAVLKTATEPGSAPQPIQVIHHHYPPVSGRVGADISPNPRSREIVGPSSDDREDEITLQDFVDYPSGGAPVIRNRHFRNVLLKGPMVLYFRSGALNRVSWGAPDGNAGPFSGVSAMAR
jgi:hypothetical protein